MSTSTSENASIVRTLFDLFDNSQEKLFYVVYIIPMKFEMGLNKWFINSSFREHKSFGGIRNFNRIILLFWVAYDCHCNMSIRSSLDAFRFEK